jgi:hypothetical protein
MPINSISDVFPGASVSSFAITIPSGALVSCRNPEANDPNEIMFGLLETMHRAVVSGVPNHVRTSATSNLVGNTFLRGYSFDVDLDFSGAAILEDLDVRPEPVAPTTTTTTTSAP